MTEPCRVLIAGCGAMGGLWAGRLSVAGHRVLVMDRPEVAQLISDQNGILCEFDGGRRHAEVEVLAEPKQAAEADIVFLFVKGYVTASVCELLAPHLSPTATVVTLQNGWGNADVISKSVDPRWLVVGVTYVSASLVAVGHVRETAHGPTYIGPYSASGELETAERVAELMRSGGFEVATTPDPKTEIWRKLSLSSACLPVSALTGLRPVELLDGSRVEELVDSLARETVAIAKGFGCNLDAEEHVQWIHGVLRRAGHSLPSMLADVQSRRRTEIETINGAVCEVAETLGLAAPYNRAVTALILGLERAWLRSEGIG